MKSCFFIGHRDAPKELYPRILEEIERHITQCGVEYFLVGHYGGFDQMVIGALREMKKKYPQITAMLLLPYHPTQRPVETPAGFDGTYYPYGLERVPMPLHIVKANQMAAAESDYMIAYAHYAASASVALVQYACKHQTAVTNLPKP